MFWGVRHHYYVWRTHPNIILYGAYAFAENANEGVCAIKLPRFFASWLLSFSGTR
jgi:hypothetical protein